MHPNKRESQVLWATTSLAIHKYSSNIFFNNAKLSSNKSFNANYLKISLSNPILFL